MASTTALRTRRAASCLALSGAAALINEVVWSRALAPLTGAATWAQAATLSSFMLGLALGYVWAGRQILAPSKGLRVYAAAELVVATWAVALPLLIPSFAGALDAAGLLNVPLRVSLAVALQFPAAVAMGTTLPAMVGFVGTGAGVPTASLYAANNAGAAVGAIVAGMWLIGAVGLTSSGLVAAILGGGAAALAWASRSLITESTARSQSQSPSPTSRSSQQSGRPDARAVAALRSTRGAPALGLATTLGFVALVLQMGWARAAAVVFGASTHAFAIVVATTIGGMALGSAWMRRRLLRSAPPSLAPLLLGAAVATWLGLSVLPTLPWAVAALKALLPPTEGGFAIYQCLSVLLLGAMVAGPAAASGAALPALVAHFMAKQHAEEAAGVGRLFAGNAVGAALGALAAPLLFGPLGLEGILRGASAAFCVLALVCSQPMRTLIPVVRRKNPAPFACRFISGLLAGPRLKYGPVFRHLARPVPAANRPARWRRYFCDGPLAAAMLASAIWLPLPWGFSPCALTSGEFRKARSEVPKFGAWRAAVERPDVLYHRDGAVATVTLVERGEARTLRINGKSDASNRGDMLTQVLSAHLPLALHRAHHTAHHTAHHRALEPAPRAPLPYSPEPTPPRSVFIIGLGSGVTATSAALWPARVEVVELSPEVVDAARFFVGVHASPLSQVDLRVADGRQALARRCAEGRRYDLIVSEPSNPWQSGGGALFSREFFEMVRGCLAPGGVFAQWIHLYETNDALVLSLLGTLHSVFPSLSIWELHSNDVLAVVSLAASSVPSGAQALAFGAHWPPAALADLARVGVDHPEALLGRQLLGPFGADELFRAGAGRAARIHIDDWPFVEYEGPLAVFTKERSLVLRQNDSRAKAPLPTDLWLSARQSAAPLGSEQLKALLAFDSRAPSAPQSLRHKWVAQLLEPHAAPGREFLIDLLFTLVRERDWGAAADVAAKVIEGEPSPRALFAVAMLITEQPALAARFGSAQSLLKRCIADGDDSLARCAAALNEQR